MDGLDLALLVTWAINIALVFAAIHTVLAPPPRDFDDTEQDHE